MKLYRPTARGPYSASALGISVAVAALTLGFGSGALLAHDFWIIPNAFAVANGAPFEIPGQTGIIFPRSVSAVALSAGPQDGSVLLPATGTLDDSAAVAAAVTAYQRALAAGDSASALALLAPDAVILESGGMETREEYRSHHLPSDIEFSRAVPSVDGPIRVKVRGDVAWAASTNAVKGQFRGRPVNSVGAELMVLNRIGAEWKIVAIHWSSRARRP